jgi:phage repressor protein C with HTH and peptisase S24 domain
MRRTIKKSGVADRLKQLISMLGFNGLASLARAAHVPRQTLESVLSRDSISAATAAQLATMLNLRPEWVLYGTGEIFYRSLQQAHEPIVRGIDPFASIPQREGGIGDRIIKLQDLFEVGSLSGLAKIAGITIKELTSIIENNEISPDQATRLANALHISPEWLLTGHGPIEKLGSEISGNIGVQSNRPVEILTPGAIIGPKPSFIMVPKAETKLSAGGGIIPEEGMSGETYAFRETWLRAVTADTKNVILLDVDGDSMTPTLLDKDTVLIDLSRTSLREGRIYAIAVGDVVQIKRLQLLHAGHIKVISDNDAYHTYEVRPDELRIIGQMIWYARALV